MTFNDLERRNTPYFAFFTEFDLRNLATNDYWLKIGDFVPVGVG